MEGKEVANSTVASHEQEKVKIIKDEKVDKDVPHLTKPADSASEEENSDDSSDDISDEKDGGGATKRRKLDGGEEGEDEDDDDDKAKTDDGDEQSDAAAMRQSKRKPSKSRIKRILPQHKPPHSTLTPDTHIPLPSMDNLAMMGAHPRLMDQSLMMTSPSDAYLQMTSGQQRPGAYRCEICGKEFRVPSRYESHMLSHSKGKPFCCDTCGKLFTSQHKLNIHQPVHSRDRKDSFACPTCGHECANWRAYLYHQAKHTSNGGKKHTCQVCGRQFHAAQRLRNHMQSHLDGKNFCCLKCGKLFESQKRLDIHSIIHDAERREPFNCVDCGKVYDDWRAFKQHMKTHGSEGVIYRCEICSAEFLTQYEKEKHKRVHTSNQRYQCQHCDKCFRSQSQLAVHERKHQGDKSHECTVCGRECARAFSLKQHMKMHAGEEEFFCHLCGHTFKKAEELTVHAASHVGEREFVCDQCGKCFAKKNHYHRHLMVHAAGQVLACGLCGKHFDKQEQLQAHMATHGGDGQRKFACLACSDTFSSQLELDAHAHTHGKSPPYVCGLCGKLFAEQRYFRQHMKRHTARAMKQKLQAQASMTPAGPGMVAAGVGGMAGSSIGRTPQGGIGDHKCHMCGQQFTLRQALITHIEEHKRSGLLMYFNLIDGKMTSTPTTQQKQQGSADGSDEESETASDSEGSEDTLNRSKTTIHFGMQAATQGTAPTKGSSNGGRSSLTEAAERAMALRMQAANRASQNSITNTNNAAGSSRASVIRSDQQNRDGGEAENNQGGNFYSAPVFPGQMSGHHATPYHAAAQQFQQNSQEDYSDSANQYGMQQKGLPGFADFRRQLGYPNNAGYAEYPDNMSGVGQYPPGNQMQGAGNFPAMVSPPGNFMPDAAKQMPGGYDPSASMPVYPDMKSSVFPGMPPQGSSGQGMNQAGDMQQQQQFDPMLRFQPLGS
ncbi:zinc finger protein 585B-like [Littorina saxatilis]|uniref:C2H2-type domain-containing protein n=1 Tax=Littorina saxatilis TaxID=31220 RepID=A0AAN9C1H7_9CAEN